MILPHHRVSLFGRDARRTGPTEVELFVPPGEVFPGVTASPAALLEILSTLSRDDTLFTCAGLNILISGPGDFDVKGRQQKALNWLCTKEQIDKINEFAKKYPDTGAPAVFFRGQLLELMRWVAKFSSNLPGDGKTFADPTVRSRFVQAALIAGALWSNRTYGERLSPNAEIEAIRRRALGALRKGVEEGNLTPHFGVGLGRGYTFFVDYLPKRYPQFAATFHKATGLTVDQYLTCMTALSMYALFERDDGPVFQSQTVAGATAYKDVFPTFLALASQSAEQLAISFWEDFDKRGYRALRDRPIMVASDGRAIILDPTFFIEKGSVGPLFYALGEGRKVNEVFGAFGMAFEDYATDMLKRMYPSRPGLVDRLACGVCGENAERRAFEIDAFLFDVDKAVIFELKAVLLREDAILDGIHENFFWVTSDQNMARRPTRQSEKKALPSLLE